MAFNLRSLASNIGNTISNAWNGKNKQNQQVNQGLKGIVSSGIKNISSVAQNTYKASKPIVTGAIKSMSTNVANTFKEKAPIVAQNFKSTATLAGQGLRGLVNNYVQEQTVKNRMLDPRANNQILLDRQKYGVPTSTVAKVKPLNNSYKPLVTPIVKNPVQPTQAIQPLGVGTTIAQFTNQPAGQKYYDLIINESSKTGMIPAVAAAGFMNESGLDEKAPDNYNYNNDGSIKSVDRGIAQINSAAHPEVTEAQARDPNFAIPWKINKIAENISKYSDVNRAIAAYNLGDTGVAGSSGPYASGLGKYGQDYVNKFAKNLAPELVKQLGIKPSSPEEEKLIAFLIAKDKENNKKKTAVKK